MNVNEVLIIIVKIISIMIIIMIVIELDQCFSNFERPHDDYNTLPPVCQIL